MSKYKTEWDFKLFYKSDTDPAIQKDVAVFTRAVDRFVKIYKNKKFITDASLLKKACDAYEVLYAMPESIKPQMYFLFRRDKDANNTKAVAEISRLSEIYEKLNNQVIFFRLAIGGIPPTQQKQFLKDPVLSKYHYFLKQIFDNARHTLTEAEEKICNLLNQPAEEMWISGFSKMLNNQFVVFKGKTLPINEAFGMVSTLPARDRTLLHSLLVKKSREISDFAESEINALFYKKKIMDEIRGYEKSYSATIAHYQNDDATIEGLVDVVSSHFKIAHRFYRIKAKLLGKKKLGYADRSAQTGTSTRTFDWNTTVGIVERAFAKVDTKYTDILSQFLSRGQVDVNVSKGKKGGAYCWGVYGMPTYVLLNHTNDLRSVITFGHEMGHAFHTHLASQSQSAIYADYSISVAEVASTFFENFVFEEIFASLSDSEKITALHDRIDNKIATLFRQIACFNFEKEAHHVFRTKGYITKEELAKLMNKHMKSYLGPLFELTEDDGYFFVGWGHIRRFFYVYAYASGVLISDALYARYKKDPQALGDIEEFMKAGSSKQMEDIFADSGLDIRDPYFFLEGLRVVEADIKRLEKLVG